MGFFPMSFALENEFCRAQVLFAICQSGPYVVAHRYVETVRN